MKVPLGWDSIRLGAGGCENLDLMRPQKCPGEGVSWDELAHQGCQGLWGPASYAPPQGSFTTLRPGHQ